MQDQFPEVLETAQKMQQGTVAYLFFNFLKYTHSKALYSNSLYTRMHTLKNGKEMWKTVNNVKCKKEGNAKICGILFPNHVIFQCMRARFDQVTDSVAVLGTVTSIWKHLFYHDCLERMERHYLTQRKISTFDPQ